ncbi:RsmB/NOP family class I SAM-dependent RNA methyltransferase [Rhizobium leucaenae]|uniref:RsmB/NOP family class I SAM-dependent RNA methyltransferase n=1 Tax=Rhizobium leucaenae TaxID=29450 RepID=UPI00048A9893|nr:RsmB/NOP family class I SAM-dependent RNA methyltransferase [Rhizobium leucaenae]
MVLNSNNKKPFNKDRRPSGNRPPRDSAPVKPGFAARAAATKILAAVIDRRTPLDGMLDAEGGNPAYRALGESDRALVRAILNSALRHLPRIEAAIASLLDSPLPEGARALHHVLVVGAAQMLYLDVPDHSAVDIAVEQANQDPRNRRFAKLVNAILRRIGREKQEILSRVSDVPAMPAWFLARLEAAYGADAASRISDTQLEPAAIDVTVKSDAEGWAKHLNGVVLPTGGVRLAAFEGSIPSLDGFSDGEWWVQDAAASIPAKLFGSVAGRAVVDLCAAPGGKTAQLILAGGKVTALDQSANRLKRLSANLARLGLEAETIVADMAKFQPDDLFDAALLDAPCSSTGTTRRHPDVLWTKGPEDIAKLAGLQERLLRHALTLVKPGGLVVFSNCSLDPEEGEDLVARVLAETDMAERVPIKPEDWPGLEPAISPLGAFRTTPDMLPLGDGFASGLDGFFAVVLRRSR